MLISPDAIVRALGTNRCLRSQRPLDPGEVLLSRLAFPALYGKRQDDGERRYIDAIFKATNRVLRDAALTNFRETIRRFMGFVIHQQSFACEWYVHTYLFNFWDEVWQFPEEKFLLEERYCEGDGDSSTTPFATKLMPMLGEADAYPDIIGLGGSHGRELGIVEVKLDELDDRAVGQILRYYSIARNACDRAWHGCDIRRIVPILVVARVRLAFWEAIPLYFREFLRIISYRVEPNGFRLLLVDARRALDTQMRERLSRAG